MSAPRIIGIPSTRGVKDPQIEAILRALKENVESLSSSLFLLPTAGGSTGFYGTGAGGTGGGSGGGGGGSGGGGTGGGGGGGTTPDLTPPPTPTGLLVTGAFSNIILSWTSPTSLYGNHAYTEIWRATTNALGSASLLGFAPGAVYTDSVGNNSTYYYWIRFVSKADVPGPYNLAGGTAGQTALESSYVLNVLSGQITESQLYSNLQSRINLIDGSTALAGSVNARISSETTARQNADTAITTSVTNLTSTVNTKNRTYSQTTAPSTGLTAGDLWFNTADNNKASRWNGTAWVATEDLRIAANTAAIQTEATTRATDDAAIATSVTNLTSTVNTKNRTYSQTTAPSTGLTVGDLWFNTADSNKASRWNGTAWVATEDLRIASNTAAIQTEATTRANDDSALASSITTLSSTVSLKNRTYSQATAPAAAGLSVGDLWFNTSDNNKASRWNGSAWVATEDLRIATNTASIQTEATTRANADNTLFAQYTVKIDVNGRVSGFGLASTANNATPTSEFVVIADRFAVVSPTQTGQTPTVPFVIGTVGGQQKVAISNAVIQDAAITNAKIASLAVDTAQIANGAIVNAKIGNLEVTEAKIADLAVGTTKIKDDAITTDKIFAGAVTATEIAANAVTADKILAGAVTAGKIQVDNLASIKSDLGDITAGSLNIGGKFSVDVNGNVEIKNSTSNTRLEITNSTIRVYDNGVLRVELGQLT